MDAWDPWPAKIQAQEQAMQEDQGPLPIQNLNELPLPNQEVQLDLNQSALNQDLHEVILNPVLPMNGNDFIELNDLLNNMMEQHLFQHENEVFFVNPVEEDLMQVAEEMQHNLINNIPSPLASPIDHLGEEVPLDQLVGPGEEGFPEEVEYVHYCSIRGRELGPFRTACCSRRR